MRRWRTLITLGLLTLGAVVASVVARPQPGPAAASGGVAAVSEGYGYTCALTGAGGVKCWGSNSLGQLGNGTTTDSTTPVDVSGLTSGVTAVSAGFDHACALTTGGGLKCWGKNSFGELGAGTSIGPETCALFFGTFACSTVPVDVVGLASGVTAVSAGNADTCALTAAGGAQCWGFNGVGQLGRSTVPETCAVFFTHFPCGSTPADVSGLSSGIAAVSAGNLQICALTVAGGVKCWGSNGFGQLGDSTTTNRPSPVDVSSLSSGVAAVSADDNHTCALTTAGGVKCWGLNYSGELGDAQACGAICAAPVDVSGLTSGATAVSAGGNHTCALTTAGGVKCWGRNDSGQLGDGTTTDRSAPVDVSGLTSGIVAVSAGSGHTCALTMAEGAKCWGRNDSGQLGDGTTTGSQTCGTAPNEFACSTSPVDVSGFEPKPTPTNTATNTLFPTATRTSMPVSTQTIEPPATEPATATSTSTPTSTDTPMSTDTPAPSHTPSRTATATPASIRGDVSCNRQVNAIDALLILQYGAGLIGSLPCSQNGDVNRNGSISAVDAQLILQLDAGIIPSLAAGDVAAERSRLPFRAW